MGCVDGRCELRFSLLSVAWFHGKAEHQVHCGPGRRRDTPVPRHATQKERGWQPRRLYLQEAHARGSVSPLRVVSCPDFNRFGLGTIVTWSPDPRKERCGEMSPVHDRARGIISTQDNLQKEFGHLARVLKHNGYPANCIRNASGPPTQETADTTSRMRNRRRRRDQW